MIQPFNSPEYYAQRGKFLLDVAEGKLKHISEIRVAFTPPEYGWIDMSIYVDGVKAVTINCSDVYDPSEDIVDWLKNILSFDKSLNQLTIDQEGSRGILTYEEYGVKEVAPDYSDAPRDKNGRIPADFKEQRRIEAFNNRIQLGLFTVYETHNDSMPIKALVSTRQFVSAIYFGLLTLAATFKFTDIHESFASNWDFHRLLGNEYYENDDDEESLEYHMKAQWTFYNIIKSPELEWYLFDMFRNTANMPDFSKIKVRIDDYIIMWAEWGDGLFWTNGGCCGNADKVYVDGMEISLNDIEGLREWYNEFDESSPDCPMDARSEREWMQRGHRFAIEIRKRLPANIDLFYYWLTFKYDIEGLPDVMNLIPNFSAK